MDSGIRDQIGLELCQVNIERAFKAQRGSDGGDNMADETIQVGVAGPFNVEILAANVINGLIVHHERTVRVFQRGVGGEDGIVRFHHGCGDLRSWIDGKLQFGLLPIVHRESLHQERSESRTSSSTERMEHEESLKARALIDQLPCFVKHVFEQILANCVVTTGIVVGGIFFPTNELFRMKQLSVGSRANAVNDTWFEVNKQTSGNMFTGVGFFEECRH